MAIIVCQECTGGNRGVFSVPVGTLQLFMVVTIRPPRHEHTQEYAGVVALVQQQLDGASPGDILGLTIHTQALVAYYLEVHEDRAGAVMKAFGQ